MRTLFVDFDGTLCTDRFWRSLPEPEKTAVQEYLFGTERTLLEEWMRGKHTAETINQLAARAIGTDEAYLWDVFVHDCKTMHVEHATLETIAKLRTKYHLVLITINMDSFDRFTVPALQLDTYFDLIVNSYNEGQFKTDNDGESFVKHVHGDITEALLIDDSPKSCATFEALGGTTYRTHHPRITQQYLEALL